MGIFSWFSSNGTLRKQSKKRKPGDLKRRLEMEPLEDRTVPSTIPVYAASAPVVTASTVSQSLSFPTLQPTTLEGSFAQFNSSLGTLESITITQNGSISSDIQVENISATSPANISASVNGSLSLSLTQSGTALSSITPDALAGTYEAAANPNFTFPNFSFSQPYGTDFGWQSATGSSTTTLTGAQMAAFIGSGMVSLTEFDQAGSSATSNTNANGANGGNIVVYIQSNAQDSITVTYNYVPSADLSITKSATPTSTPVGTNVTYSMTVTNNGPNSANQVVVTDPLPAGSSYVSASGSGWTFSDNNNVITADLSGSLANQATSTFTITATMPSTPGTVSNTATVSSATPDPNLTNNTSTAIVSVYEPTDMTITQTANPNPVLANGTLTYTITASNIGAGPASQVEVTDPLPAGTTFVSDAGSGWTFADNNNVITAFYNSTMAAGGSSTFTITVLAPSVPETITNTATVSTTTPETNYNNNVATVSTQIIQPADVEIVKTATPNPVEVSSDLTYTITVTNLGPAAANGIVVSDPLPANTTFVSDAGAGWSFTDINNVITATYIGNPTGSLADNASSFFTITVLAPPTPGTVTNTATVTSTTPDINLTNNASTVTTQVEQTDDLAITKTASAPSVEVGNMLTYTVTVSNLVGATANQVVVTDALPAGETFISALGPGWTITDTNNVVTATTPSINVGVSTFFTITVQAPLVPGIVTNTATVTSNTPDSNLSNNTSSVSTIVTDPPGTTYTQNLPPVQFGAIPIISKAQLLGVPLSGTLGEEAAQIVSLYLTLTGQDPSGSTVSSAITSIQNHQLTMQGLTAQLWVSTQHLTLEVKQTYESILGTTPTTAQINAGISQLKAAGGSELSLAENLLTSSQFLQANPSSLAMLMSLDEAVLGAVPSLSALDLSVQSLSATTWAAYVQQTLLSTQAMTSLVNNAYQGILQTTPTATQLQTAVNELSSGQLTPDQFIQQLLASSQFGQLAYENA